MPTRILVADDHAIFREGLKMVVASTVDMTVVDEAVNTQELLSKVQSNDYDMVVLDISMPGRNGLDALVEMKNIKPRLPVLVLSMHPEEQYALRAYKSGASGYLTKGSPSKDLLDALQKISMGKKYVSAALAESLVTVISDPNGQDLLHSLSNREYQVMNLIASGKTVGKIAVELSLSVKTVSTYRAHILRKLNMKNNAELTRFVIENDML
ncbi:response regulator transcription factor [Oryzomonas sagensis]|uniref:Response regulator transcription factor n=1 Tax=Oryzomonas sagensis TaxID=2603857 RepID=A0ABQ6TP71_9BACT|nr:response regulator transcription factor [Oryzomonas sagensis]KAB0670441.1 response regulator transcription factor [Oryzomonas sagensis]